MIGRERSRRPWPYERFAYIGRWLSIGNRVAPAIIEDDDDDDDDVPRHCCYGSLKARSLRLALPEQSRAIGSPDEAGLYPPIGNNGKKEGS